jgi:hypothetical protein
MTKRFSIALHDVRVSWNEEAIRIIERVMAQYNVPLTVHLVFDCPLVEHSPLSDIIIAQCKAKRLEIVFHGLTHQCSINVSKLWVFYHKYQAEYLDNSQELCDNSLQMFQSASALLNQKLGICPPCWIASKRNFRFLKSLQPLYVEKILTMQSNSKTVFSPVISLGSPNDSELFYLRILGKLMLGISYFIRSRTVRIAIHICDLDKTESLSFFTAMANALIKANYQAVLLHELVL